MLDRLFSDVFGMLHFEITFEGVRKWFGIAGVPFNDAALFHRLLAPEQFLEIDESQIPRMIFYRYEDMYFQTNRCDQEGGPVADYHEPLHQLLLQMMNKRVLDGLEEAMLDLYLILQQDRNNPSPIYPTLHGLFEK